MIQASSRGNSNVWLLLSQARFHLPLSSSWRTQNYEIAKNEIEHDRIAYIRHGNVAHRRLAGRESGCETSYADGWPRSGYTKQGSGCFGGAMKCDLRNLNMMTESLISVSVFLVNNFRFSVMKDTYYIIFETKNTLEALESKSRNHKKLCYLR